MATESPLRMPGTSGKWPSHGRGAVPNRSESAPPSMEGSFLAMDNLLSQQNLGFNIKFSSFHGDLENHGFEDPLYACPSHLAYYSSKSNLNPRLSPPLNSSENQPFGNQMVQFGSNWRLTNHSNSPIHVSQGALSTHKEVSEEDCSPRQSSDDVLARASRFSSGEVTGPLPGGQQDLADLGQEDTSDDPTFVRCRSNSSTREMTTAGESDALVDLPNDFTSTMVKDDEASLGTDPAATSTSTSSLRDFTGTKKNSEVSVGSDVSSVTSKMKSIRLSDLPNLETKKPREQRQGYQNHSILPQKQPHQQQNNLVRNQSAQSQMSSHGTDVAYIGTGQFLHGPPSKFSPDVQPVLQSSGFTPPLYTTSPTGYITSPNPMYNVQSPSLYPPQYGFGGYPLTPNIISPFIAGYPSYGAVPFVVGPNMIAQPNQVPSGGNVVPGAEMQYFDKFYGQVGQPSLADPHPQYTHYYQQPPGQAYGMINPLASRGVVTGNQKNTLESQKDEQKFPSQISGPSNQNPVKMGIVGPNYYGVQPNMGVLVHYPPSQASTPVSPSPGQFPGAHSGWHGQRGLESPSAPRLYNFLEELKSGKGRRFELSDIAGHIVEFSADQHGSRFIQQKLENCSVEEKAAVFKEVLPHACKLMTDVFGNYVIQKFFEYGNSEQRKELANQLTGQILPLSLQMYGCRVIQTALDVIEPGQKARLVRELDGHVMRCVRDQNGNHVIQKCIESVPADKIGFVISAFRGQVASLSMHPYGCRVIQRVLEHCTDEQQCRFIADEILESVCVLSKDQYGNYVTQHVLERGTPQEREKIVRKLSGHIVELSQHKFASNVIEKCLEYGGPTDRELIIREILGHNEGNDNLLIMVKDQFGNYVVQKVLETCTDDQRATLVSRIRAHAAALKRYTYGKHIVARLEPLFGEETQASSS